MSINNTSNNLHYPPHFSIITVCLNAGDSLIQTINSVLLQDFQDFELIIKDGLSKDGSIELVPSNEKIQKIQKKDSGIYDAMNQSLKYAKGQYILFLNAGDYFFDCQVLDSFYNAIMNNNFPALVYCDYMTTGIEQFVQSPPKLSNFFLFRTMLCHQVCMIKREFFDNTGAFDLTFKVDADYDFLLKLLLINKANYVHIPKLGIISTSKGFSFQNNVLAKKEVKLIRKKYFPNKYPLYSALLAMTFPSLREKLVSQPGRISKYYQRFVNFLNRYF